MIERLLLLCLAHSITDVTIQWKRMEEMKSKCVYWMMNHAIINAIGVYVVTSSLSAMIAELVLHPVIDYGKINGLYNVHVDQFLHLLTKIGYVCVF